MPEFRNPAGLTCTIDEAKPGGRLRPGYSEIVADGETVHMGTVMMRDSASTVNTNDLDSIVKLDVARERANHRLKFAFMGDRAPPFNEERAEFLAINRHGQAMQDRAYQASKQAPNAWRDNAAVLDQLRRARFQ